MISSTHCDSLGDYQHYEIENRSKFYNYEIDDINSLSSLYHHEVLPKWIKK